MQRSDTRRGLAAAAVILLGLTGLGGPTGCMPDFDPASKLDSLRILTLRAEPPEARPGETVVLDALAYVPRDASPPADGPSEGSAAAWEWRACFVDSELAGAGGPPGAGAFDPQSSERSPTSCFDLPELIDLAELAAEAQATGELPDLTSTAIDLGRSTTAELVVPPLPRFPAPPSFCAGLDDEQRQEQGGRELWLTGIRLTVSLRLRTAEETLVANKRVVLRPAADAIPDEEQGLPFRTPRLCATDDTGSNLCARNENPEQPALLAPNGEWDGEGPIVLRPGQQLRLIPDLPPEEEQQAFPALASCGEQLQDDALGASGGEFERLESRFYGWFADGGEVVRDLSILGRQEGTRDSALRAPEDAEGGWTLYLVVWDGRGGVSWLEQPVIIQR